MFRDVCLRLLLTLPLRFKGLITIPFLTGIYSQEVYGAWLQGIVLRDGLLLMLTLKLDSALIRYMSLGKNSKLIMKGIYTITMFVACSCLVLVYFSREQLSNIIFGVENFQLLLVLFAAWSITQAYLQIAMAVLRVENRIGKVSIRELISAGWLVGAVFFASKFHWSIEQLVVFCIIGDGLICIWIMIETNIFCPFTFRKEAYADIKKYVTYSGPLIVTGILVWFTLSIDRIYLANLLDLETVSKYGVTLLIASMMAIALNPINFVLYPRLTKSWNSSKHVGVKDWFSQSLYLTVLLGAPSFVGIYIISDTVIGLIAGDNYKTDKILMLYLLFSIFFRTIYSSFINLVLLLENTAILPFLHIFSVASTAGLGYFLILQYGIEGAGMARFIVFSTLAIFVCYWAHSIVQFNISWWLIARIILAAMIMGVTLHSLPQNNWFQLGLIVGTGLVIYVFCLLLLRVISKKNIMEFDFKGVS